MFVITSMLIIICGTTCYKQHVPDGRNTEGGFRYRQQLRAAKDVRKALIRQACMYISACVITWIFPSLRFFTLFQSVDVLSIMSLIFWPLQGFFIALIFIYQKVYNIQKCCSSVTFFQALQLIFLAPDEVPELRLSGLSRVDLNIERREGNRLQSREEDSVVSKNVHANHSNPLSLPQHSSSLFNDDSGFDLQSDVMLSNKQSEIAMDPDFITSFGGNNVSVEETSHASQHTDTNVHVAETHIFPIQSDLLLSENSEPLHSCEHV